MARSKSPDESTFRDTDETAIVLFTDIVGWTRRGDLGKQVSEVRKLAEVIEKQLTSQGIWFKVKRLISTGDGFALVLDPGDPIRKMNAARLIFDSFQEHSSFEIRMAAAWGNVCRFRSALVGDDITGPAVINARRILDGADNGWFLIDASLAQNIIASDHTWASRLVQHDVVTDKHGLPHPVMRYQAPKATSGFMSSLTATARVVPPTSDGRTPVFTFAREWGASPNETIPQTAGMAPDAIDGLWLIWWDSFAGGLEFDAVRLKHTWKPAEIEKRGEPKGFQRLDSELLDVVDRVVADGKVNWIEDDQNRPKVWFRSLVLPLSDYPVLEADLGGLDFKTAKALEIAYESKVFFKGKTQTLRDAYQEGDLSVTEDLPNMVVTQNVMFTRDNHLVMAQRARRKNQVRFFPGEWSPSFEEQWDPSRDLLPHETVLAGLSEEWFLDSARGVPVTPADIHLVAIGREWGSGWNTALLYVIELPCSADEVLENWRLGPKDKHEAVAVGVVPVGTPQGFQAVTGMVGSKQVDPVSLAGCGARFVGEPSAKQLHGTTGVARIVFGLAHLINARKISTWQGSMLQPKDPTR